MIIIGITGTLGAGKNSVVNYVISKYGFSHYSVRDYIVREIKKRNLPESRDSMVLVANDLRAKRGSGFIVEELYKIAAKKQEDLIIIESIRNLGEIEILMNKGRFYLLAVEADPTIRYERAVLRNNIADQISFEKFMEDEKREMMSDNPNEQNIRLCIKNANYFLKNNGTLKEFYDKIDVVVNDIGISSDSHLNKN